MSIADLPTMLAHLATLNGLCECGCLQKTNIATFTDPRRGSVRGWPMRFRKGHHRHPSVIRNYPRTQRDGATVAIHRLRAEKAIGKALPPKAIVHHVDGTKSHRSGLVICQDERYHRLLHARMRVRAAGGNPNTDVICGKCKAVKSRSSFTVSRRRAYGIDNLCSACSRVRSREAREQRKGVRDANL